MSPDLHRQRARIAKVVLEVSILSFCGASLAQTNGCGELANHYGPFDYRTDSDKVKIVEEYHFTPQVEALIHGQSSFVGGDISYLMRTSPNHPRGLMAIVRLAEKTKSLSPENLQYPVECYFDRAIRFRPDDPMVRMIYAQFLAKQGRSADAVSQLKAANSHADGNAFTHYNIGLIYFDMKIYDKALEQEQQASALGMKRAELRERLKAVGAWPKPH